MNRITLFALAAHEARQIGTELMTGRWRFSPPCLTDKIERLLENKMVVQFKIMTVYLLMQDKMKN